MTPLAEFTRTPDKVSRAWHSVEILAREEQSDDRNDPPFYGHTDRFFAKGTVALKVCRRYREVLQAAVFGYAASYKSLSLEGGLTSAVEGIERLVSTFEAVNGLNRERIDRKEWRNISKALKNYLDTLDLDDAKSRDIKRNLAAPSTLSLEERILRMVTAQKGQWLKDQNLLAGLGNMISKRNAIVHGRILTDVNELYAEGLRARTIFERLFMNFIGCHGFRGSRFPDFVISNIEHSRSQRETLPRAKENI